MRLQDLRQRAQSRISTETDEEREVRLQDLRQRAQSRLSTETDEEREVRLQDLLILRNTEVPHNQQIEKLFAQQWVVNDPRGRKAISPSCIRIV